jgi:acetyl esterase/lipase
VKARVFNGLRLLFGFCACAQLSAAQFTKRSDIEYARIGDRSLKLDLYVPSEQRQPLIVWVHGGAWRSGTKSEMPLLNLVKGGWAAASVEYRLSPEAKFPAQIHDIKAAIRFLRKEAGKHGVNADSVVIAGASAGGHLAALVGVTNNHKELEGDFGGNDRENSSVQGIISFYGAANLTTILSQSTPHGLSVREPALKLLLGAEPTQVPNAARLASPVLHVDKNDPPLLLIHGDQDPQMPINQSHELQGAYKAAGCKVQFEVVHGAAHGGKEFSDEKRMGIVREFLTKNLAAPPTRALTVAPD